MPSFSGHQSERTSCGFGPLCLAEPGCFLILQIRFIIHVISVSLILPSCFTIFVYSVHSIYHMSVYPGKEIPTLLLFQRLEYCAMEIWHFWAFELSRLKINKTIFWLAKKKISSQDEKWYWSRVRCAAAIMMYIQSHCLSPVNTWLPEVRWSGRASWKPLIANSLPVLSSAYITWEQYL